MSAACEGHSHAPASFGRAFAVGVALNSLFVVGEAGFGLQSKSLALVADAGHNLSDVLGLLLAWGATILSARRPTQRHTYGLKSSSILAALANAALLLIAIGAIAWEAVHRFGQAEPVASNTVMLVAGVGIVINAATALMFMSGRKADLNVQGAFLHMAADAGVSLGVVFAGLAIQMTGAQWIDPTTSLVIVAVIAWSTWGLLRDSVNLALHAVPENIDLPEVKSYLQGLPGVSEVHDLHIWAMGTSETALTAHLVRADPAGDNKLLHKAMRDLHEKFAIGHATLQLENPNCGTDCGLASDETV